MTRYSAAKNKKSDTSRLLQFQVRLPASLTAIMTPLQRNEIDILCQDCLHENGFKFYLAGEKIARVIKILVRPASHGIEFLVYCDDIQPPQVIVLEFLEVENLVKSYLAICNSYKAALADGGCQRLETIDMGRRGMHDEAARNIQDLLAPQLILDHTSARRVFTILVLIYQLQFSA